MVMIRLNNNMKDSRPASTRRAFTMAESVISLVVVSGMMVAALNMVGSSARTRQVQVSESRGLALANHLMTEIICNHYEDPNADGMAGDPPGGEHTRANFDDLDDYNGWTASPPQTKGGNPLAGYDGWVRKVSVTFADPFQPDGDSYTDQGLKRITVTVTSDKNVETTLTALRAADGAYEHAIAGDTTTYVGSVGATLQIGEAGPAVVSGINLLNEAAGTGTVEEEPPVNNPPVAVAMGAPQQGYEPLTVMFSGVGSYDPDPEDTLTFSWDFGDGVNDAGESVQHTYWDDGAFMVTLTVSDNHGATDTAPLVVKVAD